MVVDNSNPLINIKNLDVSDLFEDPSGEIGHLISGGVIGPNIKSFKDAFYYGQFLGFDVYYLGKFYYLQFMEFLLFIYSFF